jgi:hypothetical protein
MLISRVFNHDGTGFRDARTASLTFSPRNRLVVSELNAGSDVNRELPMTVSRLSVVTAYVAFAFVGAIVLGVFG